MESDASPGSDADSSTNAGDGSLFFDDFENDAIGGSCDGWQLSHATTQVVTVAHGGSRSCLVCLTASSGAYVLMPASPANGAGTFTITAWLAAPSDGGLVDGGAGYAAGVLGSPDGGGVAVSATAVFLPNGAWVEAVKSQPTPKSTTTATVKIYALPDLAGDCFLMDDVRLSFTP